MKAFNPFFNNISLIQTPESYSKFFLNMKETNFFELINYLVIKRVCSEPKLQKVYQLFVTKFYNKFGILVVFVLKKSVELAMIYLRNRIWNISNPESKILKIVGKWIGKLTLTREKPLWFRFLSISHFLFRAYDNGILFSTLPFFFFFNCFFF